MATTLSDGQSTPRYAAIWIFGVLVGSVIRLCLWIMPTSLARWLMERVLP